MSSSDLFDSSGLSAEVQLRIDQICDAFELSFQEHQQPRIEEFLDHELGEVETQLLELVQVELAYRQKSGETPRFDEYTTRFPDFRDALTRLSDQFAAGPYEKYRPPPQLEDLGPYEFLGAGSFGSVWKAWDQRLRRFVAVKTPIRPVATATDRAVIQREAHIVARARHPNVVPVYAAGEKNGQLYVVYQFIAGPTLQAYLKQRKPTEREAADICQRIASAVEHVHRLGIIHRDLKPGNILIDEQGEPHVMDFGLAKIVDATSTIGSPGAVLGTISYMSPEQASGRSSQTDARSDVYSIGAILYELLCKHPVFRGTASEVIDQIVHSPPPKVDLPDGECDPRLERICRKCLQKEKQDRYKSAEDLATDLQRYLNNQSVLARPVPSVLRATRALRRSRIAIAAMLVIPLLAIIVVQRRLQPSPVPPGTRLVQVTTEPPGLQVGIAPCDSSTGEPINFKSFLLERTPGAVALLPGRYRVELMKSGPLGPTHLEMQRTVVGFDGSWPSMAMSWERSSLHPNGELQWPVLKFRELIKSVELAYIPGTDNFEVDGPEGRRVVSVSPFYVATREFTYEDFRVLWPGAADDLPDRSETPQPSENTMPCRYDRAAHRAEEAGARLLTDLEFAWLAHLAAEAQAKRKLQGTEAAAFEAAGGTDFDEIPTNPPVRGILTGYAEWTSTWPSSPLSTVDVRDKIEFPEHPELYRIIRGGRSECSASDYPRPQSAADVGLIYTFLPHVSFRLAKSPDSFPPKKKGS